LERIKDDIKNKAKSGDAENAKQENGGLENAAQDCRGGKYRTGK